MKKKTIRQRAPRGTVNGKPIVDGKKAPIFSIEKMDTRGSRTGSPEKCAGARAIVRQVAGAIAAHVYRSVILIEFADRVERFITPSRLRQETISYDRGAPEKYIEGDYRPLPPTPSTVLGADHRPSVRGGGADKREASPAYPKFEVEGARPKCPSHYNT